LQGEYFPQVDLNELSFLCRIYLFWFFWSNSNEIKSVFTIQIESLKARKKLLHMLSSRNPPSL